MTEEQRQMLQMMQLMNMGGSNKRMYDAGMEMIPQLFAGTALAPFAHIGMTHARPLIDRALDEFTGVPLSSIPSLKSNDTALLYRMRMNYIANTSKTQELMQEHVKEVFTKAVYRAFGHDDKAIDEAYGTGTASLLKFFIGQANIGGEGIQAISTSLARRANILEGTTGKPMGDARKLIGDANKALVTGLIKDVYGSVGKKGAYGSLSFDEVGYLASQFIQQGALDNLTADNSEAQVQKLRNKMKSYGRAIESLKTVFDGDLPKVLKQAEALSGGSVLSMSAINLKGMADRLEHSALVTGIRGKDLTTLAQTFYTQGVGAAGGNEAFARNAAAYYSYNLTGAPRVYGVSQIENERASAALAGTVAASGKHRAIAAAYYRYTATRGGDTEKNRESFKAALKGDYSQKNLDRITAGSPISQAEALEHPFVDTFADSTFFHEMAQSTGTNRLLLEMNSRMPETFAKALGVDVKELKDINFNQSLDRIEEDLRKKYKDKSAQISRATRRAYGELSAITGGTYRTADQLRLNAYYGDRQRRTNLDKGGNVTLPNAGGMEAVLAYLTQHGKDSTIAGAVAAFSKGVDISSFGSTEYVRYLREIEKRVEDARAGKKPTKDAAKPAGGTGGNPQEPSGKADGKVDEPKNTSTAWDLAHIVKTLDIIQIEGVKVRA